ncbi:MAG: histone deacetylase [Gemmatimonadetes bacterium]|uniref:Histone deacetylase n=1 Tax=Candidatus Kutchimonas denitrificans TaxID=3056748 RepID=A0AAE5C7Q7_9BACT|nr:histone deacetylase [Gemmatimonadota bacterium]NIR73711.1 histone deacetylase [Candidatus Kutchimonas denitrificans]NIS00761.1 histone deacetylase [Gemmatimonadota bacterium]NIT66348.1 histone deacetylase [Gemmatimonadota bacterium]NIU51566.1 histone deacetylase [Gemmatimonadota bacterium]
MPTAVFSHPDCAGHLTGPGHPERPERTSALLSAIESALPAMCGRVKEFEGRHATEEELALVHPEAHIERIRSKAVRAAESNSIVFIDPDTAVAPGSWDAARAAAGTVLAAVDAVASDSVANAFCVVRPPGHHATADRAMGFCLFNNVALAVRHAQRKGLDRALIVDWDVHHGNGTEAIFYEDPSVFYLSLHQAPHYPGTGSRQHRGHGAGTGTNLNLPLPPGLPAGRYVGELLTGIDAALSAFRPDIIFISAGFDAAYGDPLSGFTLTPDDFYRLTEYLKGVAEGGCDGHLVSTLEGGYNLEGLRDCGLAHLRGLAGLPDLEPTRG